MARFTPLRITENDRKEFAKLAKNSKAKINRTLKNYGINLSNEVFIPSNIESFKTRKEFNEWKEKAGSFTNRNNQRFQFLKNEFGVVASKSEINKIKRDTKKAQRIAETIIKEREQKPIIHNGKIVSTHKQEMLKMAHPNRGGFHVPKDFDFNAIRTPKRLEEVKENMEKRSKGEFYSKRTEKMYETFIQELEEAFNSDANDLVEKLRNMNPDDFLDMYQMYNSFDFMTFYTMKYSDEEQQNVFLRRMERDVERYEKGEQYSLKGF
jgi:hypothetical protein